MPENPRGNRSRGTVRVARWSATHPWRAILLWLLFVAVCVAVGQATTLRSATDIDVMAGQSQTAARMMHDAELSDPASENVLITARHGALPAGTAAQAAADVTRRMRLPEVAKVAPPARSADGQAVTIGIVMSGDPDAADARVTALQRATAAAQRDFPQLSIAETGSSSLNNAINDQVASDLGTAADVSLPVTLLILLVVFGAVIAAGAPVLLALSAVGSAIGLSTLASRLVPDSGTTSSMILLMGMAVGVDYSLFYVKRAREEHARGRDRLDAIEIAAETSGHSVVVSGLAVIVCMVGLFLADDAVFSSLATGSIIVVAIAVIGSLTVLPALLAKLGGRVDRPRVPVLWRMSAAGREPRVWSALLRPSLRHPAVTLVVSAAALVALAWPMLGLTLHSDSASSLPRSIPQVVTFDRLTAAFPGQQTTDEVVVRAPAADAARVAGALRTLAARTAHDPLFATSGAPALRASADGTVHELSLAAPFDSESARAKQGVTELRDHLAPGTLGSLSGARWAVGGDPAASMDEDAHRADRLPWVVLFVVGMTMLMMARIFRSVVIALTTVLVNLLSAAAALGVLVLVFQHTWAQGLLGFHATGAVINWIPLFTFAVLFGLSMDYHVFVVSRIREAALAGASAREAVRIGITRSAGTVTGAAVVMVSVFSIFAALHMIEMKELGVTLAVAVLIDALVVRGIVLPSLLVLLGRNAWWPSKLARRVAPADADGRPAAGGGTTFAEVGGGPARRS